MNVKKIHKTHEELLGELEELREQLQEANETIEAIRSGQIDALIVQSQEGHQLYTLKSADQTYRVFIEKMTEGAVTIHPNGLILYCNSQFAQMTGLPLSEAIGLPFERFVAQENKADYLNMFAECWEKDCKGEISLVSHDNARVPVQLSLTTLKLDEGIAMSIILTDLTTQKNTQQQLTRKNQELEEMNLALENSNHDLQQFASIASHDLQEPLRKIQIFSNLLREKNLDLSDASEGYLKKILDSSGRMKTLIVDILNYSKLSAEEHRVSCIDLNEIVRELRDDFELVIAEKHARFELEDLPCVKGNKGQIRQVFQNVVSNALKFSKPEVPPVIGIHAKRIAEKSLDGKESEDGEYYLISVTDNGIGFDEKYVHNVFSLFERLHPKDRYEGTGIGLAIAKKIVEKHGGIISANSQEGEGAEFQIILPA